MARHDLTYKDKGGIDLNCNIVNELLPNYIDGLTSKETSEDIKEHIANCDACRTIYKNMIFSVPEKSKIKTIDPVKKLKTHIRRKKILLSIATCIVLFSVVVFTKKYEIPLPFDANRMMLTPVQAVLTTTENDESTTLSDLDHLDFKTSKAVILGDYDTLDLIQFTYQGINNASFISYSRTINRNGENIRVVFFCYYKTLWDTVFHGDLSDYSEGGSAFGDIYDESFQENNNYMPGMKEIYYLPIRNLYKINHFSDEKLDALRNNAVLIWKGVI